MEVRSVLWSVLAFFGALAWGILNYDFVTHLVIEIIVAISCIITASLLLALPKRFRADGFSFLSYALLGTAILETIHAFLYPGAYERFSAQAVEFWIYARGLFTVCIFIFALLRTKITGNRFKWVVERYSYLPLLVAILLILIFPLIPPNIFFDEETTILKTLLEAIFAVFLTVSAYMLRDFKLLSISLLLAAVSQACFVQYGTDVYTFQFVLGHAFLLSHALLFLFWQVKNRVVIPLQQLDEIANIYGAKVEELREEIAKRDRQLQAFLRFRDVILEAKTPLVIGEALHKLINTLFPGSTGEFSLFHKGQLIYSNVESAPKSPDDCSEEWICDSVDDFVVCHHSFTSEKLQVLRLALPIVHRKLEKLELVEKLRETLEILKQTSEYRVNFLRSISHELKNPLTVIKGYLQLMEMDMLKDERTRKKAVLSMKTAVEHLENLVNNLLDLSRVETERLEPKYESIKIDMFKPLIEQYEELANQKGLDFSFNFEGYGEFSGDYRMLSTILSNLLSNAVKYTDKGRVWGTFKVDDEKIVIEVSDTGKGIPKESIFEPFVGEKTSDSSGFGLAIVKKYVEVLGGKIEVESEVGKGSRFRVEIPRLMRPTHYETKEHKKVLIIEPNEEVQKFLIHLLREEGIREDSIVAARTGEEGYLKAIEHTPDVVITAIGLPDIAGDELVEKLREEMSLSHTKFVIFTGSRLNLKKDFVIEKGTSVTELLTRFEATLDKRVLFAYTEEAKENIENALAMIDDLYPEKEKTIKPIQEVKREEVELYDVIILLVTEKDIDFLKKTLKEWVKMEIRNKVFIALYIQDNIGE